MFRRQLVLAVVVLAAGPWLRHAAAQETGDLQSWLSQPTSPGTLAFLLNYPVSQPVVTRLADGLRHQSAEVRAAAARVAFVLGIRELAQVAAQALKAESDLGAAVEEARIVAYLSVDEQPITDAWMRLGANATSVLYPLANARGTAALRLLPRIRAAGVEGGMLVTFIRLAARGARDVTIAIATDAIDSRDRELFAAVLTSADDDSDLGEELAVRGLASGLPPEMAFDAMWSVLRAWSPARPASPRVRTGLEQVLDAHLAHADQAATLALELAARVVGRTGAAIPGWSELIANPSRDIRRVVGTVAVRTLLTNRELEALRRGLKLEGSALRKPTREEIERVAAHTPAFPASQPMRVASGYPAGFMSDTFRVAQCGVAAANRTGVGEAVVTFRPDGRAMSVAMAEMKVPRPCVDAARVLMMTHVEGADRIPPTEARIVMPFDAEFIACQDASIAGPLNIVNEDRGQIEPPTKTRHVPPVYPQSAIDQRIQGTVVVESTITPTGCVARADIARSIDPRLDWSALRAVTAWRFTPTLLDGSAVPVIMTVTVQFSLN